MCGRDDPAPAHPSAKLFIDASNPQTRFGSPLLSSAVTGPDSPRGSTGRETAWAISASGINPSTSSGVIGLCELVIQPRRGGDEKHAQAGRCLRSVPLRPRGFCNPKSHISSRERRHRTIRKIKRWGVAERPVGPAAMCASSIAPTSGRAVCCWALCAHPARAPTNPTAPRHTARRLSITNNSNPASVARVSHSPELRRHRALDRVIQLDVILIQQNVPSEWSSEILAFS